MHLLVSVRLLDDRLNIYEVSIKSWLTRSLDVFLRAKNKVSTEAICRVEKTDRNSNW